MTPSWSNVDNAWQCDRQRSISSASTETRPLSTSDLGYETAVTATCGERGKRTRCNGDVSNVDGGQDRVVGDLNGSDMQISNGEDVLERCEVTVSGDKMPMTFDDTSRDGDGVDPRGEKGMLTVWNDTVREDDGGDAMVCGDLHGCITQSCNDDELTGRREDTVECEQTLMMMDDTSVDGKAYADSFGWRDVRVVEQVHRGSSVNDVTIPVMNVLCKDTEGSEEVRQSAMFQLVDQWPLFPPQCPNTDVLLVSEPSTCCMVICTDDSDGVRCEVDSHPVLQDTPHLTAACIMITPANDSHGMREDQFADCSIGHQRSSPTPPSRHDDGVVSTVCDMWVNSDAT